MSNLNYANRNLQNCSFKGQDLAGADFSGSDLRGCNFTGANLIGATFKGSTTGQSRRQVYILLGAAIVGSIVLVGFSIIAAQVSIGLLSDRSNKMLNFFLSTLPVLALVFGSFFRDSLNLHFPQVTTFFGLAAITVLFAVMITLTVGLAIASLSSFSDGTLAQGFFLLLLMVVSAIVTFRILKWLSESIQSGPGTSFKKANLSNADFSHSEVQNTDFSLAILTGTCIFNWTIKSHSQFTQVYCECLYLEPGHQNRQPAEGSFQPGELERLLTQFTK
ncbi:pentapeptide repeat-containing protein [Microcoleus sp. FACHB-53]|nr:pentapeptide repeat-containing protein [Microcoleus sp. FACHB-53]